VIRRAAIVLIAFGAACAGSREPVSLQSTIELSAGDYGEVLERWTRNDRLYDKLYSVLFAHATFHSPEFRRAFLLRHRDIYGRGSEEARRLSLTSEGADEQLEFFLSAWTPDVKWNDFAEPNSIWRITIQGLEPDAEPVDGKVEKIKTTANIRVIYPYITDFAKTYAVRFPRATASGKPVITSSSPGFMLKISSGLGQMSLEWRLRPSG
jgi:hypothetical protein